MTLYSGAFVLVDTHTSTGIQYIEMMTLYSGMFVLVEILILILILTRRKLIGDSFPEFRDIESRK